MLKQNTMSTLITVRTETALPTAFAKLNLVLPKALGLKEQVEICKMLEQTLSGVLDICSISHIKPETTCISPCLPTTADARAEIPDTWEQP